MCAIAKFLLYSSSIFDIDYFMDFDGMAHTLIGVSQMIK
jgi:hypothetical protein